MMDLITVVILVACIIGFALGAVLLGISTVK